MERKVIFGTDFEGPWALNDNAFELCRDSMSHGAKFFGNVSRYDDYLVDILKKPGYKAGDTLKLIAPFLKARGITDKEMRDYSLRTMSLVPGAIEAAGFLRRAGFELHIISTSYEQYALAGAMKLGIAPANVFCTGFAIDDLPMVPAEGKALVSLAEQIAAMPKIDLPDEAKCPDDLSEETRRLIAVLDHIFWEIIPKMKIGRAAYERVSPVGGTQKAAALRMISQDAVGAGFADFVYPGDSITDREAFDLVRSAGGLSISFNGNSYATRTAEIIVASDTAWPTVLLALAFREWRLSGVKELARMDSPSNLGHLMLNLNSEQQYELEESLRCSNYALYDSATCDPEEAKVASSRMRKELRGKAIAALG